MFQALTCLTFQHDWRLVALAVAVCCLASLVTISLFQRALAAGGPERWIWLGLDSAAAGYGIWATHFIAILAYQDSLGSRYQLSLTMISLLAVILITFAGLIIARGEYGRRGVAIGGAIAGLGIAVMHFTGMAALDLPGRVTWSAPIVVAAVAFGIVFGSGALVVAASRNNWQATLAAAALLTLAILLTHFTGMEAMHFVLDPALAVNPASLSREALSAFVAGLAGIILSACLVAALRERQSKDILQQQKVLLDRAIENLSQGVCIYDADGCVTFFNKRYSHMTGFSDASLKGRSLMDLLKQRQVSGEFHQDPETYFTNLVARMRARKSNVTVMEIFPARTFRVTDNPMPEGGWVTTLEDITDWQSAQTQISHMSRHDTLTDLPNRNHFRDLVEQALLHTTKQSQVVVLSIGLDHFKDVNESLGRPIGDDLLKAVGHRLTGCLRAGDTIARLGGDEFAIVQMNIELRPASVSTLAGKIIDEMGKPFEIQGHQVIIGASIGISVQSNDGCDPDQLMINADIALSLAKENGRGAYRFFETGMDAVAQARRLLLIDLHAALTRDEFLVYYQPIYRLDTDRIMCFEALVRWNHPLRGMISPANFIPLAEETGLIVPIGDWVLRQACIDAASWPKDISVAVNLSTVQFKNCDPILSVMAALSQSGLAPKRLELEITESLLLQDSDTTLGILHKFRELDIRISLDDFGTGYSSLSYLRSFPFDKIKIDQSFIRELGSTTDSMAIVRAIIGLGKNLGITTLAEGVETTEQLALLRKKGCDEVQGYLFSKPRPSADVESMLAQKGLFQLKTAMEAHEVAEFPKSA